jgi:plasmid replication initiation protein
MTNKNELVVKSNRLVEASYRLTLAEQRIILYAIVEARRTGKGLSGEEFVNIVAADYAAMFDVPLKQAYEQIKEAAETLFQRYVVLYDIHPESGKPRKMKVRWLSTASYIDGAGTIQIMFAAKMVPFITRLEAEFTRYKLEKVAHMSSAHAIRLYELLMQWGSVGRREIELQWLKKALKLENEYQSIKNFKMRVLDVAVAQINEHSDLTASYAQRKTGRNVTHLIFTFAPKQTPQPAKESAAQAEVLDYDPELLQRLRKLGLGAKLAKDWIRQDPARAQAAAAYTEARIKSGKLTGPAAGYLRTVFEEGGQISPSAFEAEFKAQAKAAEESAQREKAEAKRAEEARREQSSRELELAEQWFKTLPEAGQRALEEEFLAQANPVDAGMYRKKGHSYLGFRLFAKQAWKQAGQVA